jgi:hypothetical protein
VTLITKAGKAYMRSSKSRSRSKQNRNNNRSMGNVINRVFDSSGPDGKVRGTPQQIIEKYNQLARDAQLANDRVATENFQQHAEHYTRMLAEAQREMDQRREVQERENRERQALRDRDRQSRDENGDDNSLTDDVMIGGYDGDEQPVIDAMPILDHDFTPAPRRRASDQDDAGDMDGEGDAAVDTSDAKPKSRKPRAPRRKKSEAAEGSTSDNHKAAE